MSQQSKKLNPILTIPLNFQNLFKKMLQMTYNNSTVRHIPSYLYLPSLCKIDLGDRGYVVGDLWYISFINLDTRFFVFFNFAHI